MLHVLPDTVELTDEIAAQTPADDDVHEAVVVRIEVARMRRALLELPPFEAWLLTRRFGIAPHHEPMTLRDLAEHLNTTHTTVRRMEQRAIERLRAIYEEDLAA